jgi:hypothetical protein
MNKKPIIEISLVVLFILNILLRVPSVVDTRWLVFLSGLLLGLYYFVFGWSQDNALNQKRPSISLILSGVIYSITIIGITFKVLDLFGYGPMLLLGWSICLFVITPYSLYIYNSQKQKHNLEQVIRSILIGLCGLYYWISVFKFK